eukprot:m.159075 g.159075  ORF g.159075 m.159075 type:complete len:330 (-) comp11738_c0_seq1:148-1137(-)
MFRLATILATAALCTGAPRAPTIPELAEEVPELSTLVKALSAADLVAALSGPGPFTVFAPTNDAFAQLPPAVLEYLLKPENKQELVALLTYHVVPGAAVYSRELYNDEKIKTLEGQNITAHVLKHGIFDKRISIEDLEGTGKYADVIKADNVASNGIVHIIDRVLIPGRINPNPPSPPGPEPGNKTIVDIAVSVPDLSTLVAAVKAADLVSTLSSPGPFTVFAPTNEAFNALPPGVLEHLLRPENKNLLVKVLTFHVVAGNVQAQDLRNDEVITTVEKEKLLVHLLGGKVYIQDSFEDRHYAQVTEANVEASNGVVHVIDKVLIPPMLF